MGKKVLVVSVHPDDETLGAGGTLLMHKDKGDDVHELLITSCWSPMHSQERIDRQIALVNKMKESYGLTLHWIKIPTTKTDELLTGSLVEKIGKVFRDVSPEIVYLPFGGDTHHDHMRVFQASWNCTKIFRYPSVKKIYAMEVLSETDYASNIQSQPFIPNTFIDITKYMQKKIEILSIFKSELGEHPFPRSIDNVIAQGTLYGSRANCRYAEAFMLLKEVQSPQ